MKTLARIALPLVAITAIALMLPAMRAPLEKSVPFSDSRIKFEVNSTAGDAGIQAFVDSDDPWDSVTIETPDGRKIFDVQGRHNLGALGATELFFESEEPSFDDLPLRDFLRLFPEGTYRFTGTTVDGQRLTGSAELTHVIPAGPVVVAPPDGSVQDPSNVVIDWDPVTDPPGIQIAKYEVIVEEADVEPPRSFDVLVPGSVTSLTVSPEFLEHGQNYKIEVLAIEVGGNQTITESSFSTQ